MKFLKELKEGEQVTGIWMCTSKTSAVTKNGKPYFSLRLRDKTGETDGRIWNVENPNIKEFAAGDYIRVAGEVTSFQGTLQIHVTLAEKAVESEYDPADYIPMSKFDIEEMYRELLDLIGLVGDPFLKALLESFFVHDKDFVKAFKASTAAKLVHHNFQGGLLEHTLAVTRMCKLYADMYPVLNKDLLIAAAACHDIGKVRELSLLPENEFTDEGYLLGHVVLSYEMVGERIAVLQNEEGFPAVLALELKHCLLAHHGELEFGSPKKPAIMEALVLSFADNLDSKIQIFQQAVDGKTDDAEWMGYNRYLGTHIRVTG